MAEWTPEQLAVKQFNKMLPILNGFARALTGKRNTSVRIGETTYTDGTNVFISLPLEMSKRVAHERTLCDRHNEDGSPACEACANQEVVYGRLFHEIGHLAYGSFTEYPRRELQALLAGVLGDYGAKKVPTIPGAERQVDVLLRAKWLNPFLMGVIRTLEDARVNRAIMNERPGAGGMISRDTEAILEGRSYAADGTKLPSWSDHPLNAQLTVAALCTTMDVSIDSLDPLVQKVAAELAHISEAAADANSVGEVFAHSFMFLSKAQEYGFFLTDNDAEDFRHEGDGEDGDESPAEEGDESEEAGSRSSGESESAGEDRSPDEEPQPSDGASGSDSSEGEPGSSDDAEVSDGDSGDTAESEGEGADGADAERADGDDDSEGGGSGDPAGGGEDSAGAHGDDEASGGGPGLSESSDGGVDSESEDGPGDSLSPGIDEAGDPVDSSPMHGGGDDGTPAEKAGERVFTPSDFGFADDVADKINEFIGHPEDSAAPAISSDHDTRVAELVMKAVSAVEHMDEPSSSIRGVKIDKAFRTSGNISSFVEAMPKQVLAPSLMRLRRAFDDNKRADHERNRRSGRVSSRVLGRRAWSGDDRLFTKKSIPSKRDYAVLIGVDISGSTSHDGVLALLKKSAYIQAELCQRLGVKFAVYAHSGERDSLYIKPIKEFNEPWGTAAISRLQGLRPYSANLDGHTLEFYRKRLEEVNATDKILMYYSDGAMPAENYREELRLIRREIKTCKRLGIELMSVGVGSDDPAKHGLDNVRIDSASEIIKVAMHLEKRLAV